MEVDRFKIGGVESVSKLRVVSEDFIQFSLHFFKLKMAFFHVKLGEFLVTAARSVFVLILLMVC